MFKTISLSESEGFSNQYNFDSAWNHAVSGNYKLAADTIVIVTITANPQLTTWCITRKSLCVDRGGRMPYTGYSGF